MTYANARRLDGYVERPYVSTDTCFYDLRWLEQDHAYLGAPQSNGWLNYTR